MRQQLVRLQDQGSLVAFGGKLAKELARAFPELIDWDLKAPTPAQLALARSLGLQFATEIPESASESRSEMHRFIARLSTRVRGTDSEAGPEGASRRAKIELSTNGRLPVHVATHDGARSSALVGHRSRGATLGT